MEATTEHVHGTTTEHMNGGDEMGDCEMAGMMMYFHTGHCETVLFDGWRITSIGGLIGSAIGIMCLAALYEILKVFREFLYTRKYKEAMRAKSKLTTVHAGGITSTPDQAMREAMFSGMHGLQTALHALQILLSYFLMLVFMTYNVWLCLAVVIGGALGYFFVGWKKSAIIDITEHCH